MEYYNFGYKYSKNELFAWKIIIEGDGNCGGYDHLIFRGKTFPFTIRI